METFQTKYGSVSLYSNDKFIVMPFKKGEYWDEAALLKMREYIDPDRNILEIGGHCGTSSIVYASYLNKNKRIYVYEPQRNMYDLLVKNVRQNQLQNKIIPYHSGVFCFKGTGKMNDIDLDCSGGNVMKRYKEEIDQPCNFGGISLGSSGESINLTTIDQMNLYDIGFIHCDAQGSENFIFSEARETIKRERPVILFEDNERNARYLYDRVCQSYPQYGSQSRFNLEKYCMEELNYTQCIYKFNNSMDNLLIP